MTIFRFRSCLHYYRLYKHQQRRKKVYRIYIKLRISKRYQQQTTRENRTCIQSSFSTILFFSVCVCVCVMSLLCCNWFLFCHVSWYHCDWKCIVVCQQLPSTQKEKDRKKQTHSHITCDSTVYTSNRIKCE